MQTLTGATGNAVPTIIGWAQYSGNDTILSASTHLAFAPLQAMLGAGTATGAKVMAYLLSSNDVLTGSPTKETLQGMAGNDSLHGGGGNDKLHGRGRGRSAVGRCGQ